MVKGLRCWSDGVDCAWRLLLPARLPMRLMNERPGGDVRGDEARGKKLNPSPSLVSHLVTRRRRSRAILSKSGLSGLLLPMVLWPLYADRPWPATVMLVVPPGVRLMVCETPFSVLICMRRGTVDGECVADDALAVVGAGDGDVVSWADRAEEAGPCAGWRAAAVAGISSGGLLSEAVSTTRTSGDGVDRSA